MILIIDDDIAVQASLNLLLKQEGFQVKVTPSPVDGIRMLQSYPVELVILDMNFSPETSGQEGLNTIRQIKTLQPALPVILITGWASIALAVEGMKLGAADFISKPWINEHFLKSVKTALSLAKSTNEPCTTRQDLDSLYQLDQIVGNDPLFLKTLEIAGRIASTDAPVLINGESGTGKELIAEAIHRNSSRKNQPFVKVNLGGISSSLFESEMFGHKKGAFTDAHTDRKGRFEMAHGGTIFLDEIGELDLNCQVKLLRVLQDRTFEVLGDSKSRSVDVRVICATNRPLEKMIETKQFREDLFYRINLITIKLPALRERSSDIALLVNHFLEGIKRSYGFKKLKVTDAGLQWLRKLNFPGNVRELKNLVERTVLISNKEVLDTDDFASQLQNSPAGISNQTSPAGLTIDEMEELMIRKNLELHHHNLTKVAKSLGLSRGSLYRRLDKYGIPYEL